MHSRIRIITAISFLCVLALLVRCSDDDNGAADGGGRVAEGGGPDAGTDGVAPDAGNPGKVPTTTCNNSLTAPSSGTCTVTKGSGSAVLYAGIILAPDRVYKNGHLLVDGGKIVYVGCDASKSAGFSGAARVTCKNGVISPGLINTHDHLGWTRYEPIPTNVRYDHRHEWRVGKNGKPKVKYSGSSYKTESLAWGELRMIIGGATSIMAASAGATKLLRNLDGKSEGLSSGTVQDVTFPLGDTSGTLLTGSCSYKSKPDASKVKGYSAWVPHVSEGGITAACNEFKCLSGQGSGAVNVTLKNAAYIHSVGLRSLDVVKMAAGGTMTIWSPRSNISLYGYTAEVVMMNRMGIKIALGTDWTISGSMNMLRELACAAEYNKNNLGGYFSDFQLWEMATANAALSMGVESELGKLKAGQLSDVAIFDGSKLTAAELPHRAVVQADVSKVVLVTRGKDVLYGDTTLVKALDSAGGSGCEALTDCLASKSACVKRETGKTLSELKSAALAASPTQTKLYPLYFCKAPDKEPSCVPTRPSEFTGKPSATDSDGDGIADAKDNCPKVFNPVRKMDNGKQPDTDSDKLGDSCDVCPFDDKNKTPCKGSPDLNDSDGDSIPNAKDNCPNTPNKDQKDSDNDKQGDACDKCPQKPNPGGAPCPATIKELRDKSLKKQPAQGTLVMLKDVTVTVVPGSATTAKGFYVRESKDPWAAIYVYTGKSNPQKATDSTVLKPGHVISITGTFTVYNNIDEVDKVTKITINTTSSNTTVPPAPVALKTADLQPGSASAEKWESHLVAVSKVTVAVGPTSSSDAFWVTDKSGETCTGTKPACTKVGDYFYDGSKANQKPLAAKGGSFSSIKGVVNGFKDGHTLDPSCDADLKK